MSKYPIIAQLQYGTASAFGKNLCISPSRIVPLSQKEIPEPEMGDEKSYLYYLTPRQEREFVCCKPKAFLFEPSVYFRPPHTFLQSVLFLIEPRFYQVAHLPQKRRDVLLRWLKDKLEQVPEGKKFLQQILSSEVDTDPGNHKYFPILVRLLEATTTATTESRSIQVVHADSEGKFKGVTKSREKKKSTVLLLQLPTGWYAPYGILIEK